MMLHRNMVAYLSCVCSCAFCHCGEILEDVAASPAVVNIVIHHVCWHDNLLLHHVRKGQHGPAGIPLQNTTCNTNVQLQSVVSQDREMRMTCTGVSGN